MTRWQGSAVSPRRASSKWRLSFAWPPMPQHFKQVPDADVAVRGDVAWTIGRARAPLGDDEKQVADADDVVAVDVGVAAGVEARDLLERDTVGEAAHHKAPEET